MAFATFGGSRTLPNVCKKMLWRMSIDWVSLVHGSAHSYFGAANKNVGDAFLVSWKLCDGELNGFSSFDDEASEEQRLKANSLVKCSIGKGRKATPSQLADAAICSFLRCQLDLEEANREGELREYSQRPSVQQRFGDAFAVKMGFGMHVGWAVEGAIGSSLKIDATYLSPHVEMSDRLEAASKVFGTPLNLSHWLRNLASPSLAAVTRPVARLKADGVSSPFDVFALDVTDRVSNFRKAVLRRRRFEGRLRGLGARRRPEGAGVAPPPIPVDVEAGLRGVPPGRLGSSAKDVCGGGAPQAGRRARRLPPVCHGAFQQRAAGRLGRRARPRRPGTPFPPLFPLPVAPLCLV